VQVVEELGRIVWSNFAELEIVEISDDINWRITEYAGIE